jgi:hypothetical protein
VRARQECFPSWLASAQVAGRGGRGCDRARPRSRRENGEGEKGGQAAPFEAEAG